MTDEPKISIKHIWIRAILLISSFFVLLFISIILMLSDEGQGLGQNMFVSLILIIFTFLIVNFALEYDKHKRWVKIENRVMDKLSNILHGIFIDIIGIGDFELIAVKRKAEENLDDIHSSNMLNQLKSFSKNKNFRISKDSKKLLIEGMSGQLFKDRELQLSQIETKYLEYLHEDVIISLMDMQFALYGIDIQIAIRKKYKDNDWAMFGTDESLGEELEHYFQILIDNLNILHQKDLWKH